MGVTRPPERSKTGRAMTAERSSLPLSLAKRIAYVTDHVRLRAVRPTRARSGKGVSMNKRHTNEAGGEDH